MTIRTLRPSGTVFNNGWSAVGSGSLEGATSDNWDGSYARCPAFPANGDTLKLDVADITVPAGATVASVREYARVGISGFNHGIYLKMGGSNVAILDSSDAVAEPQTLSSAAITTRPGGGAWTQADINSFQYWLTSSNLDGNAWNVYDLWVDVLVNDIPNLPTSLTQVSNATVTTPTLGATVSSPDGRTCKGRFEIYQSDGTTLITSIDSALVASGAQAQVTYGTPLALGQYKFRVKNIDSLGLESAWTSLVDFQILTAVSRDRTYLWNALQLSGSKDITGLWNIVANNAKIFGLVWNTLVNISKDTTFKWNIQTSWTEVDPEEGSEWGGKQPRTSDIWTTVEP